jgi:cob(I)alamin adenosyltransferase
MIHIFTGNGKGKTTAAFGTALRALWCNKKVQIIQFLKTGNSSEILLLKNSKDPLIKNNLTIYSYGLKKLINPKDIKRNEIDRIDKGLKKVDSCIKSQPFLLILDEFLILLKFKFIKEEKVIKIIQKCNKGSIHLVLTGRGTTKKIIENADLVTKMQNIKHPYDQNIFATKGLDY